MFSVIVLPLTVTFDLLSSQGMNMRNGTDADAGNMMKVFTQLGYKVKINNDLTVKDIKTLLYNGKFYSSCMPFLSKIFI